MVLRCPSCSQLEFFGRAQMLGDLVVCPRCETVFGWREATAPQAPKDAQPAARESKRPKAKS